MGYRHKNESYKKMEARLGFPIPSEYKRLRTRYTKAAKEYNSIRHNKDSKSQARLKELNAVMDVTSKQIKSYGF